MSDSDRDLNPRPNIIHLFGFTFWIALFFAFVRPGLKTETNFLLYPLTELEVMLYGIGIASCWTGMGVLLVRGIRRGTYAREPGEVICLAEGSCYALLLLIGSCVTRLYEVDEEGLIDWEMVDVPILEFLAAIYFAATLPLAFIYLLWAIYQKQVRWKVAGATKALAHAIGPLMLVVFTMSLTILEMPSAANVLQCCIMAVYLFSTVAVIGAAILDFGRRKYDWLHWLGIIAFCVIYLTRIATELRILFETWELA